MLALAELGRGVHVAHGVRDSAFRAALALARTTIAPRLAQSATPMSPHRREIAHGAWIRTCLDMPLQTWEGLAP
jgi:hypothetical protein